MKKFRRSILTIMVLFLLGLDGTAQTATFRRTISTFVGPPLPVSGAQAITQVVDSGSDPVSDGGGGFYFVSLTQNRVYRAKVDGTLLVIAGTAAAGFGGDGGLAIDAELNLPTGITLDAQGNLFIADLGNNRVRKVNPAGIISTIAGVGVFGSDGDGGPATSARVNPFGLAVDRAGNLFIAEIDSNRVRKINTAGIISTVAGDGTRGFGGDNGPAVSAQLFGPERVVVDAAGNLYIADTFNDRIRKVTAQGIMNTVAGIGGHGFWGDDGPATSALLSWPSDIALTSDGSLLVADGVRIRSVSPAGIITTIAGGGTANTDSGNGLPALSVQLGSISGLDVDASGNIFLGESDLGRIRKITPAGIVTTVAGNGRSLSFGGDQVPASAARLRHPWGISFDAVGNLFIADTENNQIRVVNPGGIITTVVGPTVRNEDDEPATADGLSGPRAVISDAAGDLFIADTRNHRIRKVKSSSLFKVITTVAGNGTRGFTGDGEAAIGGQLADPSGIAVDGVGNLYIADTGNHRIRKVTPNGVITTIAGTTQGFSGDGGPATSAQLAFPSAITLDRAGNIFVADSGNNRVRKITPAGVIVTIAGVGQAGFSGENGPATAAQLSLMGSSETHSTGLVVDLAGQVYIADTGNHRIRKVSTDGVITTIAGSSVRGFSGDGGQATLAQLFNPSGIAMDRNGQVFISDTFNNRVRKLAFATEMTFTIPDRGGAPLQSSGASAAMAEGYASIQPDSGSQTPAGLAILGFRQNDVLVGEVAMLAAPVIQSGRFYVEFAGAVKTGVGSSRVDLQACKLEYSIVSPK